MIRWVFTPQHRIVTNGVKYRIQRKRFWVWFMVKIDGKIGWCVDEHGSLESAKERVRFYETEQAQFVETIERRWRPVSLSEGR